MSQSPPRRRRWLSFSLRGLMIAITVLALWLGWWVNGALEQRAAVEAIYRVEPNANLTYDNEYYEPTPTSSLMYLIVKERKSWAPEFIEERLGRDFFHNVESVIFAQGSPDAQRVAKQVDLFRKISRLRQLETLTLRFPITDADARHIARLPRLRRLHLRVECPELTDAGLEWLERASSLESLTIHSAPITDAGLAHLARLRQLRYLVLGTVGPSSRPRNLARITDAGLAHLAGLANLIRLDLDSAEVTGDGLKRLSALGKLEWLGLNSPRIGDDDLARLAPLLSLERLELAGTSVQGAGFEHIVELELGWLFLTGPSLRDEAVAPLARLPKLQVVMFDNTSVTAAGLEKLCPAPRLRQINIHPAIGGDTQRLKQALPNCSVVNGDKTL